LQYGLSELNWELVVSLVVISALVAYIGDILGMKLGKRRISLFGMRPKYTSRFITVVTGILITLVTLFVMAMASDTVRVALFNMKYIQREISTLTDELSKSRGELESLQTDLFKSQSELLAKESQLREVESSLAENLAKLKKVEAEVARLAKRAQTLERDRERLSKELEAMRKERDSLEAQIADLKAQADELRANLEKMKEGKILVLAGELLMQMPVDPSGLTEEEVKGIFDKLKANAKLALSVRTGLRPERIEIFISPEELDRALRKIKETKTRKVIRLEVASNAVIGERIDCKIEVHDSVLVYRKGEVLASEFVAKSLNEAEAEQALYNLLRQVNLKAQRDGVIPDPITGTVGNIEATEFFDVVDGLSEAKPPFTISVIADSDIYTEGPVRVKIEID